MRIFVVLGALAALGCSAAPTDVVPDAGIAPDASAQALDTTIRVHYPTSKSGITLRGDAPLHWDQGGAMSTMIGGYELHVALSAPIAFKPWLGDATEARGPSFHVAPGATVDVYPHFLSSHGKVEKLFAPFHSDILANDPANDDQTVWAYLPPSYDENTLLRYPVLYMHDGQNLWNDADSTTGVAWHVERAIDDGVEAGTIAELIVIAPEHGTQRIAEYSPWVDPNIAASNPAFGGEYAEMLVQELKPRVDATLRTHPERESTGALGSSLGGLMSAYEGLAHPEVFGLLGEMSPSIYWDGDHIVFAIDAAPATPKTRIYVDRGAPETTLDEPLVVQEYEAKGFVRGDDLLEVVEANAVHDEAAWGRRLPGALAFLFPPR